MAKGTGEEHCEEPLPFQTKPSNAIQFRLHHWLKIADLVSYEVPLIAPIKIPISYSRTLMFLIPVLASTLELKIA